MRKMATSGSPSQTSTSQGAEPPMELIGAASLPCLPVPETASQRDVNVPPEPLSLFLSSRENDLYGEYQRRAPSRGDPTPTTDESTFQRSTSRNPEERNNGHNYLSDTRLAVNIMPQKKYRPAPTFQGNEWEDPAIFMRNIEEYCSARQIEYEVRSQIVVDSLRGQAYEWFEPFATLNLNYDYVKQLIINRYDGPTVQARLKYKLFNDRQNANEEAAFFIAKKYALFRRLVPELSESEIIMHIKALMLPKFSGNVKLTAAMSVAKFTQIAMESEGHVQELTQQARRSFYTAVPSAGAHMCGGPSTCRFCMRSNFHSESPSRQVYPGEPTQQSAKLRTPKFQGNDWESPLVFLRKIEEYCNALQIAYEEWSHIVADSLCGHAYEWFEPFAALNLNYDYVKQLILNRYDGPTVQGRLRFKLFNECQDTCEGTTLFIAKKYALFRRLIPELSDGAIIAYIRELIYPKIASYLIVTSTMSIGQFTKIATELEGDIQKMTENARSLCVAAPLPGVRNIRSAVPLTACRFCGGNHFHRECPRRLLLLNEATRPQLSENCRNNDVPESRLSALPLVYRQRFNFVEISSLPRLYVQVCGRGVWALLDSGASHSFINTAVIPLPMGIAPSTRVRLTDGQYLNAYGPFKVQIRIADKNVLSRIFLLAHTSEHVILGQDWLKANNAQLNCKERTLTFGVLSPTVVRWNDVMLYINNMPKIAHLEIEDEVSYTPVTNWGDFKNGIDSVCDNDKVELDHDYE